jgi:hypothetical protein
MSDQSVDSVAPVVETAPVVEAAPVVPAVEAAPVVPAVESAPVVPVVESAPVVPAVDSLADETALFMDIYTQVKSMLIGRTINMSNIASIAVTAMQVVEKCSKLHGFEKKEVVINVINQLINELPVDADAKLALTVTANAILPTLIDTIISAANGQLDLHTEVAKIKSCFSCSG